MKIILGRRLSINSLAVRMFTWSKWSHVGAILDDGITVIESVPTYGVRKSTVAKFKKEYSDHIIIDLPATKGWEDRLKDQLGKPYDWSAIISFVLRKDWQSPSKWFCSELVAYASGFFNSRFIKRITPQHLVMFGKDT